MENRSSLEKYLKPSPKAIVWGVIFIILGIAAGVVQFLFGDVVMLGVVWIAFGVIIGSILIAVGALQGNKFKKKMDEFDKNGDLQDILYDFETGKKIFNGSLILGKYFLISKRSGTVVEYSDIDKLYQLVKGYGARAKRVIQVKTVDKKKVNLCRIPISGSKTNEELGKALGLITAKNRNIQL